MNARHPFPLLLLALGLGLATASVAQPVTSTGGEPAWDDKAAMAPMWRDASFDSGSLPALSFREMDLSRIAEMENRNARETLKPTQIGLSRLTSEEASTSLPSLQWQSVAGGAVSKLQVGSPDAMAMRVGLRVGGLDPRIELRFAGSDDPSRVVAMVPAFEATKLAGDSGVYWSPVTDGERQVIEVFAPAGVDTAAIQLRVPEISHLITNSRNGFSLAKIGESGGCNVDTACRIGSLGQNFVDAKNAVARMVFTDGGSFLCTGTLLNDTVGATQVPYFYTAQHCISTQPVASTLNTFWGYEATSCASGVAAATSQLATGATLLYSSDAGNNQNAPIGTDASFLRLNSAPPAGAFFAGWDASVVAASSAVLAIHHPAGDVKKSSVGQHVSSNGFVNFVGWSSGTTEGGSSGSGLFTLGGSGYALRGGLWGGFASCANTGNIANTQNRDWYSRLDVAFPSIQQYLAPTVQTFGPSTGRNYTGAWYVPSESGWGLTAFQFDNASKTLFVMFFIYDQTGKAQWFELGGTWSATDVRSGDVLQSNGPPWGPTFNPALRSFSTAGNASLTFTSATTANLTLTVNGATRNVAVVKL